MKKNSAFTLFELLIVVVIISILAAMLLPAISNAKSFAKRTVCINNLKQIGVAAYNYEVDNNKMVDFLSWLYPKQTVVNGDLTKGLLFDYLGMKETYLCPTEVDKLTVWNDMIPDEDDFVMPNKLDHSYIINCYSCHVNNSSQFITPSETIYFMEKTNLFPYSVDALFGKVYEINFRHKGRTMALKMDSHVEIIKRKQFYSKYLVDVFWYPTNKRSYY